VTIIRSKSSVPYPYHYATPEQVKNNPTAYRLNCAQRAHGQLLENMPQTMLMMLLAGLRYPVATRWLGLAWMGLRTVYWAGYVYSSKTQGDGRKYGGAFWFVQGLIWALAIGTAGTMI
jgi:glutathione S-transferase